MKFLGEILFIVADLGEGRYIVRDYAKQIVAAKHKRVDSNPTEERTINTKYLVSVSCKKQI